MVLRDGTDEASAKAVMEKIPRDILLKEREMVEHLEAIDKCVGN